MTAAIHNFIIEKGSDFEITFQYLDASLTPINLETYCVSLLWKSITDPNSAQGFSSSLSKQTLVDGWMLEKDTNGNITFSLSHTFTKTIPWSNGVYDLYVTDNSLNPRKHRISTGTIQAQSNNFPECAISNVGYCADCVSLSFETIPISTPTPSFTVVPGQTSGPSVTPTPTPSIADVDICSLMCDEFDMYTVVHSGNSITIADNSAVSGTISISNTGIIENIEVMVYKLKHQNPQDLAMILVPPTGNKILLSAHNKILHNNVINGFSFIVSNKAANGVYINNVMNTTNPPYVNILDKTSTYKYNNETLANSLQSWIGSSPSGDWTLIVKDDDIGTSGTIQDWRLLITYAPPELSIDEL